MELNEIKNENVKSEEVKYHQSKTVSGIQFTNKHSEKGSDFKLNFLKSKSQFSKTARAKIKYLKANSDKFIFLGKVVLLLAYFVYFGFALSYHIGDEGSWRLIGCTICGILIIAWHVLKRTGFHSKLTAGLQALCTEYSKGNRSLILRWLLYIAMSAFFVIYLVIAVAMKTPENLWSLIGLLGFPLLLYLYSNNKCKVNWHTVFWAMAIQFIMALLILKTSWGANIIRWVSRRLEELLAHGVAGSIFLFGKTYKDHYLAFGATAQIFVVIIAISVLTFLGVIKAIVDTVGRALAYCLGTSPAEGINAVGNIFLHVPESAMLVQEYLHEMTPSQLFATYAGALSTVGGTSLVVFMASGIPAAPLIAASAMSAPAALAACKLCFPSHNGEEVSIQTADDVKINTSAFSSRRATSLMESIIIGIRQSTTIVVQLVAFVLAFVIIMAFLNSTSVWFGERIGVENMTLEFLFSYMFYPFAFMMGAKSADCLFIGELLGVRTISLAIVAFPKLGPIIQNGIKYREYIAGGVNNTWTVVGNDIVLDKLNQTLVGGIIDHRSEIIATYALCGSASFAIMGLILGTYGVMLPERLGEITQHIFRAMIVGTVASYLTACFAGLLHEDDVSTY
ncbi:solute carrier family 28 member 3-like [Ruditapes philippinarum]|uniref:solute carrier family 28 member 3-like n=1 Tax=Ruditapes philippinarum TaxID=129788 RepID=UPI00295A9C01|nr:solute carrier family 28 member 3-like [Ruditapes philippinarum]